MAPLVAEAAPVSNRMKVDTKSAPMVYSSAQCTGGSSRHAVACLALCKATTHQPQLPEICTARLGISWDETVL